MQTDIKSINFQDWLDLEVSQRHSFDFTLLTYLYFFVALEMSILEFKALVFSFSF